MNKKFLERDAKVNIQISVNIFPPKSGRSNGMFVVCSLLHALQLKGTVFGLRHRSATFYVSVMSLKLFLLAGVFSFDHEFGIFTTTVSVVPSAAVVVISCGSWICTGRVVLLLVTCNNSNFHVNFSEHVTPTHVNGNFLRQGKVWN